MRQVNPDKVAPWFDPWKLKVDFLEQHYDSYGAPLAKILNISEHTATDKVSLSRFSHEETIAIAKALHYTPERYCQVFLRDVFKE